MHVSVFIHNDEGAFKLPHVFRVDAEVRLERDVNVNTFGNINERSTRPHRCVKGGEFIVAGGNDGAKILAEQLFVFAQGRVCVKEDHAFFFEVLADLVVHDFGFILGSNTCNEALFLGLRDAEAVVGIFDVLGQVLPGSCLLLSGPHEVLDVIEINV